MVDLWLHSRHYNKEHPLMEVHGGDFVICDDGLYESFVEFKKTVDYQEDFRIVREVDLLSYWMKTCKVTSIRQVTLMDKVYYLMTASDLDALCEWIYDTRKEWNETKTNSSTPLKCKLLYMLCISEYLVNTFVLFSCINNCVQ